MEVNSNFNWAFSLKVMEQHTGIMQVWMVLLDGCTELLTVLYCCLDFASHFCTLSRVIRLLAA